MSSPSTQNYQKFSTGLSSAALDCIPDPIVITELDGLVCYGNGAAQDLFFGAGHYSSSSLMGQRLSAWMKPTDWNQVLYRMRSQVCNIETQLLLDDGVKPVAIAIRRLIQESDSSVESETWLWRFQDLTLQQQQQAEWLERTVELERSSRHMSEFLSNMSHELRTPLTSILGFSSLLKQQIFGDLNEKQSLYIRQIHGSGQYLLALINDILDLSKIEAGQLKLEKTDFSIIQLCEEAIESVQQQAQVRQISIRSHLSPDIPRFWADEIRLRQIVLNLLSNAIKFSELQGAIDVRTYKREDSLYLEVQDYGVGIAPEKQSLIFQPFQQVDSSIERRRQGTGLGLALTKHLAQLHGGTVSFTSAIGSGSCFVVQLPIFEPVDESVESDEAES